MTRQVDRDSCGPAPNTQHFFDIGARILGGMTKPEARQLILNVAGKTRRRTNHMRIRVFIRWPAALFILNLRICGANVKPAPKKA
jgi:hypothetical protein